ncbi:YHR209W [Saccharomyces arboricola H-6]|uniref:YHR209W n=1 Tax=Saccharomyces arboricola (strain H-6 / AS 2.3317 / CBS 10644) TaxID=1160507 RepID=J8Q4G2_SACAR|nr:YHR209W [Saccharomyces arboricola H-6]
MPKTSYLNKTFKSTHYNNVRPSYPQSLVNEVLKFHKCPRKCLVDIGCGTGKATFLFEPYFEEVIGIDPSSAMLSIAEKETTERKLGHKIRFINTLGEELSSIEPGTVDMVISAEAIHWCNLERLFQQLFFILRPNGTFAFWFYVQPEFVDFAPEALNVYYKYAWGKDYMGQYLDDKQKEILLNNGGEKLRSLLSERFKNIEVEIYNPSDKDASAASVEKNQFIWKETITLAQFKQFVKSWSIYSSWMRDHPSEPDIADIFVNKLKEVCHCENLDKPLNVEWSTFYFLCRKKD